MNIDLKNAFPAMEDSECRALMDAARSVKEEEKPMKRPDLRLLLIAAIVVVSMLTAAVAAGDIFGFNDFYGGRRITLSPATQRIMQPPDQLSYQVGPLTFTVQERMADPYYAAISTRITRTDGARALVRPDHLGLPAPDERIGATTPSASLADTLGVDPNLTWTEAAVQLGLPLYHVQVRLQKVYGGGAIWDSGGSMVYISDCRLEDAAPGSTVELSLCLEVIEIDPATGEPVSTWSANEPYAFPICKLLAEGRYVADRPKVTGGMTLVELQTELYETAMYVRRIYQAPADMPRDPDFPFWAMVTQTPLKTAEGDAVPQGVNLSRHLNTLTWPTFTLMETFNVSELPQILQVGRVSYILQDE